MGDQPDGEPSAGSGRQGRPQAGADSFSVDSQGAGGSPPASPRDAGRSAGPQPRLLPTSSSSSLGSGFPLSSAPARPAAPSPAELLTSFFTSVRSSSVRDGAGASMAEARMASFRPAPPRPGWRAPVSRNQAGTLGDQEQVPGNDPLRNAEVWLSAPHFRFRPWGLRCHSPHSSTSLGYKARLRRHPSAGRVYVQAAPHTRTSQSVLARGSPRPFFRRGFAHGGRL